MNQFSPIGVFDSGVGGLTVLKALRESFPQENYLYMGDTANVPYGAKSKDVILKLVTGHLNFFSQHKVKALVLACNTASTLIAELPAQPYPIFGVIKPGARKALESSRSGRIGVIATRATIASQAYPNEICSLNPQSVVISMSGALLVPLAEEGWVGDPITNLIVQRYCNIFAEKKVDTLVLGCTHYPILKSSFSRFFGSSCTLIESGPAICEDLENQFANGRLLSNPQEKIGTVAMTITDHSEETFKRVMQVILGTVGLPEIRVL